MPPPGRVGDLGLHPEQVQSLSSPLHLGDPGHRTVGILEPHHVQVDCWIVTAVLDGRVQKKCQSSWILIEGN